MKTLKKTQENNVNSREIFISLQSQIENLSQENSELKKQVEWFKQQFKLASQRQFAKSSETTSSMNLTLFDEAMPQQSLRDNDEKTVTYTIKQ